MGTLIRGNTVLLRSGTIPHIGDNGNWFIGSVDTGVNAKCSFFLVDQTTFDNAYAEGIYYIVTGNTANVWHISETGTKTQIQGEFTPPYIGDNGNWFIGDTDTNKQAVAKQIESVVTIPASGWVSDGTKSAQTVTVEGFTTDVRLMYINPNLADDTETAKQQLAAFRCIDRYIPGENSLTLECFSNYPDVDLEVTIGYTDGATGLYVTGVQINDGDVNNSTTWSSYQIKKTIDESGTGSGKGLEFQWDGTKLGVRQEGAEEYTYSDDLTGTRGLSGLDGSSIIDGYIDERGHLILTMQDPDDDMPTNKILALAENGILTKEMILSMLNSINRLNQEVLRVSPAHHEYDVPYTGDTASYMTAMRKIGHGNCQIVVTDFTGKLKLTVDDVEYTAIITDITTMDHFNLLVLDNETKTITFTPVETDDYTGDNDIVYEKSIKLEVDVDSNEENEFPTFSIKGNHFDRNSGDVIEGDGYYEELTDKELNDMLEDFTDDLDQGDCDCGLDHVTDDDAEELTDEEMDDLLGNFFS